jgi:hypothetical protein
LQYGTIVTDAGNLINTNFNGIENLGKKIELLIDNNTILSTNEVKEDSKVLFVNTISGNNIEFDSKAGTGQMDIADGTTFYYNGQKTQFSQIKDKIITGSIIAVAYVDGTIDYGVFSGPILSEPVTVSKSIEISDKLLIAIFYLALIIYCLHLFIRLV